MELDRIERIASTVAKHYGVRVSDIRGHGRTKGAVLPRHVAMFLLRCVTPHSLKEIGGYFGGRHHTTVMHAFQKIRRKSENDLKFAVTLDRFRATERGEPVWVCRAEGWGV